jgi:hypothetical protein
MRLTTILISCVAALAVALPTGDTCAPDPNTLELGTLVQASPADKLKNKRAGYVYWHNDGKDHEPLIGELWVNGKYVNFATKINRALIVKGYRCRFYE